MSLDIVPTVEPTTPWIVVTTHPHREATALENLRRQSFEGYCPMITRRVRHARRTTDVSRPLFPGYIFVRLPAAGINWAPILSTKGVRALVRFGTEPGLISGAFIARLKAREVDGRIVRPDQPFKPGDPVRLVSGPFDGLIAEILELADNDRLIVLMGLLNQTVRVTVESSALTALPG
jgi:transcriptional antiterminator RfaH